MREMIVHVIGVVSPIVLCVVVGFRLARARRPFDNKMVGSLVSTVGYPTLILSRHVPLERKPRIPGSGA